MGTATTNAKSTVVEFNPTATTSLLVRERRQIALFRKLQAQLDALNAQRERDALPPLRLAVRFCFERPVDAPLLPRIAVRYLRNKPASSVDLSDNARLLHDLLVSGAQP